MRVLSAVLLTLFLVTSGHAKSLRLTRAVKGGSRVISGPLSYPYDRANVEDNVIDVGSPTYDDNAYGDEDDDPSWTPTDEDYAYLEEEERLDEDYETPPTAEDHEDDLSKDPNWVPTAEDYALVEADEALDEHYDNDISEETDDDDGGEVEEEYDDDEDELWSSDDDPDWKPSDHGYDDYDEDDDVQDQESEEDPDWVPGEDDYDDDEDDDNVSYDDDDDGDDGDDYYEYEDEEALLNEVLFDIALLLVEKAPAGSSETAFSVFNEIKKYDLSIADALSVLERLESGQGNPWLALDDDQQDQGPDQDQTQGEVPAALQQANGVKVKRQVKTGQYQPLQGTGLLHGYDQTGRNQYNAYGQNGWEDGQFNHVSHTQRDPVIRPIGGGGPADIGYGVEPLTPEVHVRPSEVGYGVVPLGGEEEAPAEDDSSFIDWLNHGWGHFVDTADKVGDKVGETVSDWGEKISDTASGAVDTIQDAASNAVDAVRDAASTAGAGIVGTYHHVKGNLGELRERIRKLFTRFGVLVQRGADYCIQHLGRAVNQVREAEILDKLQQKLAEGNEHAIAFFQLIGEKVTHWRDTHGQSNVDAGLIIVDHPETGASGGQIYEIGEGGQQQAIPNFYQDEDVIVQLNQFVDSGVITQADLDQLLLQQQTQHHQQQAGRLEIQQHSPVQATSSRRRSLRALIDALKAH